jgi:hypothetical protein
LQVGGWPWSRQLASEFAEAEYLPVLDVLLPDRGDLASQVTGGAHQVHLGPPEVCQRVLGYLRIEHAEQFVADHHVPTPRAGLADQSLPRARHRRIQVLLEVGLP